MPPIVERPGFWWDEEAVHVQTPQDFRRATGATYFAHVNQLGWAEVLRGSR